MMKGKLNQIGAIFAFVAILSTASLADFPSYSGSLSYGAGLYTQGSWAAEETKIEWTVNGPST